MIEIRSVTDLDRLDTLKSEYLARTTTALDGMWLCGFLPLAEHFEIRVDALLHGYFCVNDQGYLLQFYLGQNDVTDGTTVMRDIVSAKYDFLPEIKGAFVSTAEPEWLSFCFDSFDSFHVNAVMYQLASNQRTDLPSQNDWALVPVEDPQLSDAVEFILDTMDVSEDWLVPYFSNLIHRGELFGCWHKGNLIGTGENRQFDDVQQGYTELGMVVGKKHRCKGLATWIMTKLVQQALDAGLKPICSTEVNNIGAKKAIMRAGFVPRNRIIQFVNRAASQ